MSLPCTGLHTKSAPHTATNPPFPPQYVCLGGSMPFWFEAGCGRPPLIVQMMGMYCDLESKRWSGISPAARDLMCRLLHPNPKKRLSASKALLHPWIATAASHPVIKPVRSISRAASTTPAAKPAASTSAVVTTPHGGERRIDSLWRLHSGGAGGGAAAAAAGGGGGGGGAGGVPMSIDATDPHAAPASPAGTSGPHPAPASDDEDMTGGHAAKRRRKSTSGASGGAGGGGAVPMSLDAMDAVASGSPPKGAGRGRGAAKPLPKVVSGISNDGASEASSAGEPEPVAPRKRGAAAARQTKAVPPATEPAAATAAASSGSKGKGGKGKGGGKAGGGDGDEDPEPEAAAAPPAGRMRSSRTAAVAASAAIAANALGDGGSGSISGVGSKRPRGGR